MIFEHVLPLSWMKRNKTVPLEPLVQSLSFGIPFVFFMFLHMLTVKVVVVFVVGKGTWSLLVITEIGLPSAETSKDCLSARMSLQSRPRPMEWWSIGRSRSKE